MIQGDDEKYKRGGGEGEAYREQERVEVYREERGETGVCVLCVCRGRGLQELI